MTSSARTMIVDGTVRSKALAVLRLTTSSNLFDWDVGEGRVRRARIQEHRKKGSGGGDFAQELEPVALQVSCKVRQSGDVSAWSVKAFNDPSADGITNGHKDHGLERTYLGNWIRGGGPPYSWFETVVLESQKGMDRSSTQLPPALEYGGCART